MPHHALPVNEAKANLFRALDHPPAPRRGAISAAGARDRVTAVVLLAGLTAVAAGAALAAAQKTLRAALALQAAGAALIAVAGFWILATDESIGAAFTSEF